MTIETKMLKPLDMNKIERIVDINDEVKELILLKQELEYDFSEPRIVCDKSEVFLENLIEKDELKDLILARLEGLESELNLLGYTFEDEPKEWQYHVNILRGEDDE